MKLRLGLRFKVARLVRTCRVDELLAAFEGEIAAGSVYGDFQYSCDERDERYLREGVLSCYRPVPPETPVPEAQLTITEEGWRDMVYWGHVDKARAYDEYVAYYLASSGQVYWSDTHQLIPYDVGYHDIVDRRMGAAYPATEMIHEAYVPRAAFVDFTEAVRADFLDHGTNVVYGTIRLIEQDDETFLAWAKQAYACVIFNLHVEHTPEGISAAQAALRRLIDRAVERRGNFFLTYHRWATREQLLAAYPEFPEFLRLKRRYDPDGRFQSDWYRHVSSTLFAPAER